ncbi:MAG: MurR/RpiR family transcriptional regulator [Lactovum sp.]
MDVRLKIKQAYENLNKNQKRIADVFLHDAKVLTMSIGEIGRQSETSASTVTRFVRKFDFESLESFRIALAQSTPKSEGTVIDPIIKKGDSLSLINEKIAVMLSVSVMDTASLLDNKVVEQAICEIKKARRIYLFGVGASAVVAYDLTHKFNRAGFLSIFQWDTHIALEGLNYISDSDVLIAFSYSGQTKETLLALEIAKERGAKSFLVSRNQEKKLQKLSQIISIPSTEHLLRIGAITSMTSAMQVASVLFLGTIESMIDTVLTQRMLETAELVKEIKEEEWKK